MESVRDDTLEFIGKGLHYSYIEIFFSNPRTKVPDT